MSRLLGDTAEQLAKNFLVEQGLRWMDSNYHCRWGEIDLVMKDSQYLIFIEVRSRISAAYGGALASITHTKQKKIIKTAQHYQLAKKIYNKFPCRFDVLTLQGEPATIQWIKNAFSVS